MPAAPSLTVTHKRIPEFDGIRGVAILLVLAWHCFNNLIVHKTTAVNKVLLLLTDRTWSGVDLFFVLSGFLLGTVLLKNRYSGSYFSTFYIRRICRIFPLYYSFLLIYYILNHTGLAATMPWVFKNTLPYWAYLFFVQNFFLAKYYIMSSHGLGHTYSLAIEEQFYLVLPFLVYFLKGNRILWVIGAGFVMAFIFRVTAPNWIAAFALPYCRADALLMGLFTAFLVRSSTTAHRLYKNKQWLYGAFAAILLLIGLGGLSIVPINYYLGSTINTLLFTVMMILVCIDKESWLVKFFSSNLLQGFGRYSFGIYIYHKLVMGMIFYAVAGHPPAISNTKDLLVSLLGILCTCTIAVISFHAFEKRIVAWGHRFKY